jgi:CO/xanthine dehydrogenase Mo-binding subunit
VPARRLAAQPARARALPHHRRGRREGHARRASRAHGRRRGALGEIKCQAPLPNDDGTQNHLAHIPLLAKEVAKHLGDAIAFVVADTVAQAKDAVEAIEVHYEVLPAVVGIRDALKAGAPAVWKEGQGQPRLRRDHGRQGRG